MKRLERGKEGTGGERVGLVQLEALPTAESIETYVERSSSTSTSCEADVDAATMSRRG